MPTWIAAKFYRVILWWVVCILGFFLVAPWIIRGWVEYLDLVLGHLKVL